MTDRTAPPTQASPPAAGRRHELDLLGMGIVLTLVFLHTITIFSGQQVIMNVRHLFDTGLEAAATLDQGQVPAAMLAQFQESGKPLSSATVTVTVAATDTVTAAVTAWTMTDQGTQYYLIKGPQAIHVRASDQGPLVDIVASFIISFVVTWAMPLIMLIAGIAIQYSLRKRGAGEFVRDRLLRLLVPFLVGLVLTMPLQTYFAAKFRSLDYQETFWQFFPRFWNVRFDLTAFPIFVRSVPQTLVPGGPEMPVFDISHLWFLLYLLVYTLLLLPLFLYLRSPNGARLVERLAGFFSRPWTVYLLALPLALIEGLLATEWPSGWNRFIWPVLILYGYVFASDERFTQVLVRHRKSALWLGINGFMLYFGLLGILINLLGVANPFIDMSAFGIASRVVKGLASWFWIVAILGFATYRRQRAAEKPSVEGKPSFWERAAAYGREAQVPFYVLHQLPIIVIGYYVIDWNTNALVKFLVICLASYAVTFALYDLVVRRIPGVRFLFGARARRKERPAAQKPGASR